MRTAIALSAIACVAVLTGGCTDESGDASNENVLETQQKALESARDVEQDLAEAARRQGEEIERSESGG